MKDYVEEAVDFIRGAIDPRITSSLVRFSGGKDSICVRHLAVLSHIRFDTSYSFTGIDPPEVVAFIKKQYPETRILRPRKNFWHLIQTHNPPLINARWCCTALKKASSWKLPHRHRILGIRSEESARRKAYPRIDYNEAHDHFMYYPILNWKEWQVWEFIEEYQLPYPSLYDEGFDRLGCVICPYHSGKNCGSHWRYAVRWPTYFIAFTKAVEKWYAKRVKQGRVMAHGSAHEFVWAWYQGPTRWYEK